MGLAKNTSLPELKIPTLWSLKCLVLADDQSPPPQFSFLVTARFLFCVTNISFHWAYSPR